MKLFGLVESMYFETMFFQSGAISIPHHKLFEKLETFGSDLSVGLELASPDKFLNYGSSLKIINQKINLDLYDFFKSRGNKIYFLEPRETYMQLSVLAEKGVSIRKQIEKSKKDEEKEFLYRELDKISVEADYILKVGKEGPIFENIVNHEPDLVFLGDGHAVRFYKMKGELYKKHEIEIDEYWKDEITKTPELDEVNCAIFLSETEEIPIQTLLENEIKVDLKKVESVEQVNVHPESIKVEREYKALRTNRVTDGNPHFIGTWNPSFEYRGLFEVYVIEAEDGNLSGVIEDPNGSARFSGKIQDGKITFNKTYTNPPPWAIKGEISFIGHLNLDGEFYGNYAGEDGAGIFKMKQVRNF